jgi:hypothetical protein
MSEQQAQDDRNRKERSPSSPFISLKKAVERLQQLDQAHKRNPARVATIATTWDYGLKSSGLLQTIAALKQYGLIEEVPGGDDRKIKISDLGWRYLYDLRPGAKEIALREAALKPKLFAEHYKTWGAGRPSDAHCISELHLDRGFTQESAKTFLKVFDETVSFVNLRDGDSGGEVGKGSDESPDSLGADDAGDSEPPAPMTPPSAPLNARQTNVVQPPSPGTNRATFPLPEGVVAFEFPEGLSADSLEDVRAWLEVVLRRASRKARSTDQAPDAE